MSVSGGVSISRTRGENRFYNPPHVRRQRQQQQQQQKQQRPLVPRTSDSSIESEKRPISDECASLSSTSTMRSDCSVSGAGRVGTEPTNLDQFLEHTTPLVPAQYFSKMSMRRWSTREPELPELHPYFVLGDLWESFKEWSAYGAGVPLVLNGCDSVVQYYVPYLSAIQLYVDPSKPSPNLRRRPGEESHSASSRESCSDDSSSDCGAKGGAKNVVHETWSQQDITDANIQGLKRLSLRNKTFTGSSSDESETCNPPSWLVFEYMEHDPPFGREPLADKIAILASQFPKLKTYRSCDLSPSSWVSVAWYPIYRIPTGPTLQNLDACFLTFHSLSTPFQSTSTDGLHSRVSRPREVSSIDLSFKLSLPIFGLASYKFKVSVWNPNGVYECQKGNSLLQAADNWLRLLQVNHPDYRFFTSHNSFLR